MTTITMKLLLLLISIGFCSISFGQNACFTSIKYGDNSEVGRYAVVNRIRMYYETYGDISRQPLLLIHGNGGYIYAERCQIEHFKDKYYVIIADSRYHGKTENGSELLTYDLMVKIIIHCLTL
jgi:hypothetical protein